MSIDSGSDRTVTEESSRSFSPGEQDDRPRLLSQADLEDLVRDLGLSKKQSELLGSRLK